MEKNKENIGAVNEPGQIQSHADWKKNQLSADQVCIFLRDIIQLLEMFLQRGSILGETPLSSQPRSVFEFMSEKDRQRIQSIRDAQPAAASMPGDNEASLPEPRHTDVTPGPVPEAGCQFWS